MFFVKGEIVCSTRELRINRDVCMYKGYLKKLILFKHDFDFKELFFGGISLYLNSCCNSVMSELRCLIQCVCVCVCVCACACVCAYTYMPCKHVLG